MPINTQFGGLDIQYETDGASFQILSCGQRDGFTLDDLKMATGFLKKIVGAVAAAPHIKAWEASYNAESASKTQAQRDMDAARKQAEVAIKEIEDKKNAELAAMSQQLAEAKAEASLAKKALEDVEAKLAAAIAPQIDEAISGLDD